MWDKQHGVGVERARLLEATREAVARGLAAGNMWHTATHAEHARPMLQVGDTLLTEVWGIGGVPRVVIPEPYDQRKPCVRCIIRSRPFRSGSHPTSSTLPNTRSMRTPCCRWDASLRIH